MRAMENGNKLLAIDGGAAAQPPPSCIGILRDGAGLLRRSWKPVFSILLVFLLPFAFVFFAFYLSVTPLATDLAAKTIAMISRFSTDPQSPELAVLLAVVMRDIRVIAGVEGATVIVSGLLSQLFVFAVLRALAAAGSRPGEQVTAGNLIAGMGGRWKGALITGLYIVLLGYGYLTLVVLLAGLPVFVSGGSPAAVAVCVVFAVLATLLLEYLRVVWSQGLVIAVVAADRRSGLAALGRASELIRGRRRLGFAVNLLLLLLNVLFAAVYHVADASLLHRSRALRLAGWLFVICGSLVISAFTLAVYVAFYYECRRSHAQEEDDGPGGGRLLMYTRVPTEISLSV